MRIWYDKGIWISDGSRKIVLDPETSKVPIGCTTYITHAHSDHTAGLKSSAPSYCTPETYELVETTGIKPRNTKLLRAGESIKEGELDISFHRAGHLLGAVQILVKHGTQTVLFTGDFCPEDLLCVKGAEIQTTDVDVLIMETTYGSSKLNFRPRQSSRMTLLQFCVQSVADGLTPVINVSQLGGAQEIITTLNEYASPLNVIVDEKISAASDVFRKFGHDLKYDKIGEYLPENAVVLLSRSTKNLPKAIKGQKLKRVMVSGQTARFGFRKFDFAESLSTHACYTELLSYVDKLNPSLLLTHYTYAEEFSELVRLRLGTESQPLTNIGKDDYIDVGSLSNKSDIPEKYLSIDEFFT